MKTNKPMEMRMFEFEIRAEQNEERGHFLEGRPIVYESRTDMGWYDEIIAAGALEGTDLRDVRLLVNHNIDMIPLARSRRNTPNSTMQLLPVAEGMDFRADLDTENNTDARNLYSAVGRGDLSGMSFMFTVDTDEWQDRQTDHPTRIIRKIGKVFEISAVTFPAYDETAISTRGLAAALDSARRSLDSVLAADKEIEQRKQKIRILSGV